MATCTIVVTYTPGVANGKQAVVTSFTVDGTAFGSLTDLQKSKAIFLGQNLANTIRSTSTAGAKDSGKGHGGRDITS